MKFAYQSYDVDRWVDEKDFNWLTDEVATGGIMYSTRSIESVRKNGFTAVLDCQASFDYSETFADSGIEYLHNPTADDGELKPVSWFETGLEFALPLLDDPDTRILIHCGAGINRGPSMAYAVIRAFDGLSADEALDIVFERRIRPSGWGRWGAVAYHGDADYALAVLGYAESELPGSIGRV